MIKIAELSSHLDLHAAEAMALDDFGATSARSTADVHDHGYDGLFDEDSLDILDSHKGGKRECKYKTYTPNLLIPSALVVLSGL
jgi:hypothetical protein